MPLKRVHIVVDPAKLPRAGLDALIALERGSKAQCRQVLELLQPHVATTSGGEILDVEVTDASSS